MGLFTPAWRGKDPQKRAAAIERMDDRKLLSVIRYYTDRNPDYVPIKGDPARVAFDRLSQAGLAEVARDPKIGGYLRCEAVKKIDDEAVCLAIIRGCSENRSEPEDVGMAAVDRLSQAALAGILRDPDIKSALKEKAIRRIDDERILLAYLQENPSVIAQRAVLKRLHTGSLILGAVREDRSLFRDGWKRLKELGDRDSLREMAMERTDAGLDDSGMIMKEFEAEPEVLKQLYSGAASDTVRADAIRALAEKGMVTETERADAEARVRELIRTENPSWPLISRLLRGSGPIGNLSEEEKQILRRELLKHPTGSTIIGMLKDSGDSAGIAFQVFCDGLYWEETRCWLTEDDYARVLEVDEDYALDYLLALIRTEGNNGSLGGPQTLVQGCAAAILRMHQAGKARERIERELPKTKDYCIRYTYQDSEGDIWNEKDEFSVTFWE